MIYSVEEEEQIMRRIWSQLFKNDPVAFVMYAFPWGVKGTPLEEVHGLRAWQKKYLRKMAEHIGNNHTRKQLSLLPEMMHEARSSGRGIGKSALVSMLVIWFISCHIGATTLISANTETQLRSITFPEIAKWHSMSINSHWFDITGIKLNPKKWLTDLVEKDLKKGTRYWGAEGKLWSEEKPDAYAGPHNFDGMMVIFDEASGIPDGIWVVAEGFFTEPTMYRYFLAFSNPRRTEGTFYDIVMGEYPNWGCEIIDARDVEGTDPNIYKAIIDKHGEDSDTAHIEVYGIPPLKGEGSFISKALVKNAVNREKFDDLNESIIMGIDPGKGNPDPCVCIMRQGRNIDGDIREFKEEDPEKLADVLIDLIEEWEPDHIVVDEGGLGWGLIGLLKRSGYKNIQRMNSAWKSSNPVLYANKRAEMWAIGKSEIRDLKLPNHKGLSHELSVPKSFENLKGALTIQSKIDLKKEGHGSTNYADAFLLTLCVKHARRNKDSSGRSGSRTGKTPQYVDMYAVANSWMSA